MTHLKPAVAFLLFSIPAGLYSCKIPSPKDETKNIIASMNKAAQSGVRVEGRFVRIEETGGKEHDLYVKVGDSVMNFKTGLLLDKMEISLLETHGNNIILTYEVYANPVTGQQDKIVRFMQPVYKR